MFLQLAKRQAPKTKIFPPRTLNKKIKKEIRLLKLRSINSNK